MNGADVGQKLASEGISKVKQFMLKRNGQTRKTGTILLTLGSTTLLKSTSVGYLRVKVEVLYLSPSDATSVSSVVMLNYMRK